MPRTDRPGREATIVGHRNIGGCSCGRNRRNARRGVRIASVNSWMKGWVDQANQRPYIRGRTGGWRILRCVRGRCVGSSPGPSLAEAHPLREVVQSERIGQRSSIAPRAGRVVRLDHHIADPAGNKESKDTIDVAGQRNQYRKHHQVNNPLGILPVVHCAHAGNKAKQCGQPGARFAHADRRSSRRIAGCNGVAVDRRRSSRPHTCCQAGFAEGGTSNIADAFATDRLAAVLAKGGAFSIGMVCAIHAITLSPGF
jgi:hypothetical protein